MNIALLSPSQKAYSETFIQAHKESLKGRVFYYFSGWLPSRLEGGIVINSRKKRIIDIIKGHYRLNRFSLAEQALITSFKKSKINVVFAEYGATGQRILPVCKELNLPLIVHFHGYDAYRHDQFSQNNGYKEVFDYAQFVIVVSKKMYNDLLGLGCPKHKLVYNVYGPRDEYLKVQPKFSKQQFIAVGRFVNKKAPYYLILSILQVVKRFPNTKLILAGNGELIGVCKNLVKFYGLEIHVEFVGVITPDQFRLFLEESLAFVQHSITADDGDSEGTPVSILEASAAGLPVISTYHAGIPDVIEHKKTGFLTAEHDVDGMAENMIRLLENPGLAKELGKNGKEHIGQHFTLQRHIDVLDGLIAKAVEGQGIKN